MSVERGRSGARALTGRWLPLLLVLLGAPACDSVQNVIQRIQQQIEQFKSFDVDEEQLRDLLNLNAASNDKIAERVFEVDLAGQVPDGNAFVLGGAPHFRPQASDDTCPDVAAARTTIIEDYSACTDNQAGQIKYEIERPETDAELVKVRTSFNGYSRGSSDAGDAVQLDGVVTWTFIGNAAGILISSKEQMDIGYQRRVTVGEGFEQASLQSNNHWTYELQLADDTLVVNATATYTDLQNFDTVTVDFQEATFSEACPTQAPSDGSASLSGSGSRLLVDVIECARALQFTETVTATATTTESTEIGSVEMETIFGNAKTVFDRLLQVMRSSDIADVVRSAGAGALDDSCSNEFSGLATDAPETRLAGTWCAAYPLLRNAAGAPEFDTYGSLECWRFCQTPDQVLRYQRYGGIASNLESPDDNYVATDPYYVADTDRDGTADATAEYPPTGFAATCSDFVWETGTWYVESTTGQSVAAQLQALQGGAFAGDYSNSHGQVPLTTITIATFVGGDGDRGRLDTLELFAGTGTEQRLEWWIPALDDNNVSTDLTYGQTLFNSLVPLRGCGPVDYELIDAAISGN